MTDIFVSYARPDEVAARRIAEALRALNHGVWMDDQLPAHRLYAEVIEERLMGAKVVLVVWSKDSVKSEWVRAEADMARERRTLLQVSLDGVLPPLPFNQIQCSDLRGWPAADHPGWTKITGAVASLIGQISEPAPATVVHGQIHEPVRIAVELHPVVTASGADADGMAAGFSDAIATAMSRIPSLLVVTAGGARGDQAPDYIAEGALQRVADNLRLTARLRFRFDGAVLWSEHYDSLVSEMFEFQDRSATKIAALIDSTVRTLEIGRSSNLPEERMDVRQLYYRAIGILRTNDRRILPDGARCLERLLQVEPDHVHALGLAATIYLNMWQVGLAEDDSEAIRLKALDRASSALGLAMDDHWAVGLASMTLAWAGDQVEASVTQLDRILSMAPSFAIAWFWSGFVRIRAGDPTAAIAHLERAMEFDPRTPVRPTMLGYLGAARVANGDDAEALRILNQAIALRPHWTTPRIFSAIALAHLGRVEEARRQLALSEHHAPVAKFRWPTRDASQRERLCDGLTRAGAPHAKPVFADI